MTSCQREDCDRPASVFPVLLVYTTTGRGAALAEIRALQTCWRCARKLSVEDFMGHGGWEKVRAAFSRTSHIEPDRARTRLRWQHIREARVG